MNKHNGLKLIIFGLLILLSSIFFYFEFTHYLTLDYFKSQHLLLTEFVQDYPLGSASLFFIIYIIVTALSFPGAALLSLVGGALFGLLWGTILVSFASTIGATLAFLTARFLLRDVIEQRFYKISENINCGIQKDGAFYLFTLRLVPAFPFFVINLLMGLTQIKTWTFYWVSQIGMLAGTIVYVNAGTQLAQLSSTKAILSPALIISFTLLGIFPLITKRIVAYIQRYKLYQAFKKPGQFSHNVIIIGAGAAGLIAAYLSAALKAKVLLIEKHKMGGECLYTGCIPSKTLLNITKFIHHSRLMQKFGVKSQLDVDFSAIMERIQHTIRTIEPHDSVERYQELGVECLQGQAKLLTPYQVAVDSQLFSAPNIILATGARPKIPAIQGLDTVHYVTSDTLWDLKTLPPRLLVLGGGAIGCELAQAFARLGSEVTLVHKHESLLPRLDKDITEYLKQQFQQENIQCYFNCQKPVFERRAEQQFFKGESEGKTLEIAFDVVLLALGKTANIENLGLEQLGIQLTEEKQVAANQFMQTNFPNIYVCGDISSSYQFTHIASYQAWFAAINSLFGDFKQFAIHYHQIPFAIFTDPEIACVGLTEQQAQAQNIPYTVTHYTFKDLNRAMIEDTRQGRIKILTKPHSDKILGVTIIGTLASEILIEFTLAMKQGIGLNKILSTIHIYPSYSEANKLAAGVWKKNHQPVAILKALARFHDWKRGNKA